MTTTAPTNAPATQRATIEPAAPVTKLGYVTFDSPDVQQMVWYYTSVLGFDVVEQSPKSAFLTTGSDHHCVVINRGERRARAAVGYEVWGSLGNADHHAANFLASKDKSGMHHIAYEMRDPNHLVTLIDHLAQNNFRLHWGPGRHGPGHNLFTYHRDPDGNTIELFTQLDVIHDESKGCWVPSTNKYWNAEAQNR